MREEVTHLMIVTPPFADALKWQMLTPFPGIFEWVWRAIVGMLYLLYLHNVSIVLTKNTFGSSSPEISNKLKKITRWLRLLSGCCTSGVNGTSKILNMTCKCIWGENIAVIKTPGANLLYLLWEFLKKLKIPTHEYTYPTSRSKEGWREIIVTHL